MEQQITEDATGVPVTTVAPARRPHGGIDYRRLLDGVGHGVFRTTLDGVPLEVNDATARMLGYGSPAELLRRVEDVRDLYVDRDQRDRLLQRLLEHGQAVDHDLVMRRTDGDEVVLSMTAHLVDEAGEPAGIDGFLVDVTEQRLQQRELAEARARITTAFRHAPIGMALVGLDGAWLEVNDAIEEITRRSREELMDLTFGDITHPDDLDADLEQVNRLLAGEIQSYELEKRYLRPDGTPTWVLLSGSLVRDEDGEPLHFIAQIQDVDQRRRIERELQATAERLELLVETAPVGIVFVDVDGAITFANQQAEEALHLDRASIEGRTYDDPAWQVCDPEGGEFSLDELPFAVVARTVQPVTGIRHGLRHADGTVTVVAVNAAPLKDECGAFAGMVAAVADVTERHEQERTASWLSALVTSSGDAITSETLDGIVTSWNPAAERMYGLSAQEMLGTPVTRIVPDGLLAERAALVERLRGGATIAAHETRRVTSDGREFDVALTLSPITDGDGDIVAVTAITRDISEQARLREELAQHAEDLARSNLELEQFASVAAHDLQEPLRMVHSFVQLLARSLEDQLDDQTREYIHYAVDGASRMQALVQDLLAWSRVGTRGTPPQPCGLDEVLDQVESDLRLPIEESGATIVRGELPTVLADPRQAGQLLANLIGNAVKFRDPEREPRIEVTAEPEGGTWRVSVADNGVGIPPHQAERVFEIFQRLHGREDYPGTGIGLAICKRIVERHGGEIVAIPCADGTTMQFTLPAADGPAHDTEEVTP